MHGKRFALLLQVRCRGTREKIERETSEHEPEELKRMCSKKLTLHTANGEHNIEYCNQANAFIKPDHVASVSCGVW